MRERRRVRPLKKRSANAREFEDLLRKAADFFENRKPDQERRVAGNGPASRAKRPTT